MVPHRRLPALPAGPIASMRHFITVPISLHLVNCGAGLVERTSSSRTGSRGNRPKFTRGGQVKRDGEPMDALTGFLGSSTFWQILLFLHFVMALVLLASITLQTVATLMPLQ